MKRIIAILLVIVIVIVGVRIYRNKEPQDVQYEPFSGARDKFPKGYTGGYRLDYKQKRLYQPYLVESYDEVCQSTNRLLAHNSTLRNTVTVADNSDLFDVKYRFLMNPNKTEFPITFGEQSPFERQVYDVMLETYIFFEDVSLEEICYGDFRDYKTVFSIDRVNIDPEKIKDGKPFIGNVTYEWDDKRDKYIIYNMFKNGVQIVLYWESKSVFKYDCPPNGPISDEAMQEIINSLVCFGYDD